MADPTGNGLSDRGGNNDQDGKRSIEIASGSAAVLFCLNIEALEMIKLGDNSNCAGAIPPETFFRTYWVTIRR
jgi:hypothetical protein